jgi:hypothetical protein
MRMRMLLVRETISSVALDMPVGISTKCIRPVKRTLRRDGGMRQDGWREWYALNPPRQQSAECRGTRLAFSSFWD